MKLPKHFRVTKDGKVEKTPRRISVSKRIQQKSSKKIRPVRRTP